MLNTTERQIAIEVMMDGMPKCSEHEWRHKEEKWVGFCPDFGFCPVGSCSAGGFCPQTRPSIYKVKTDSFSISPRIRIVFPLTLFRGGLSVHA